ncbi:sigma54-dependent transcription regulator [Amycolatopsis endophytica]|uniref:Sigma54-dependent transcription regulator n=1 Tax=Amycolatopsis endophytica TaxID=860233 RepID=A0A853B1F7_9PSEU|nr:hypothetical protein [Amycolatopsis endophytica]NYI88933.1 sigma54-dependent transcription regulator [Amycolatopsis endophytica]
MRTARVLGMVGIAVVLAGCAEAAETADRASACAQALGLANLNPNATAQEVADQAQQKAGELRDLGNQVADQTLKENLFAIADSYVALEQRKSQGLSDVNDWIQTNAANLDRLRQACT